MANRFTNPLPQFLDANGDPYSGGSLEFYESGTSTPLETYSDDSLSTANPNPLSLDSAGRPANPVFLEAENYKVILKDGGGGTVWTEDPVRGGNQAQATTYKGDYANTVAVNLRDELDRRAITPQMFGAVGDGTTDDTTAFTDALSAAETANATLYVPHGNYVLSSLLTANIPVVIDGIFSAGTDQTAAGIQLRGQPLTIDPYIRMYADGNWDNVFDQANVAPASHTAALRAAARDLMYSRKYTTLDMQGRRMVVNGQINVDVGLVLDGSPDNAIRMIANGIVEADSSATSSDYIFRVYSNGPPSPSKVRFSEMTLNCFGYMSGVLLDGNSFDNQFFGCRIRQPATYGIAAPNGNGVDILVNNCVLEGDGQTALENRTTTGIYYTSNDLQISNCIIKNHKTQLHIEGGGSFGSAGQCIITNTHFYGGGNAQDTARRAPGVLLENVRSPGFTNCYFDGQPFLCLNNKGDSAVGFFQVVGSLFQIGANMDGGVHNYVEIETAGSTTGSATVQDVLITGCRFNRVSGGSDIAEPFGVRGNGVDNTGARNVHIYDNTFTNVQPAASRIARYANAPFTSNEWNIDLTDERPFNLSFLRCESVEMAADSDPGRAWVEITGNSTFKVHFANNTSAIGTGRAHFVADVNDANIN